MKAGGEARRDGCRPRAHGTPSGTTVTCEDGSVWRVTKRHHDYHGRRGAVCSCGWERVYPEEAAA